MKGKYTIVDAGVVLWNTPFGLTYYVIHSRFGTDYTRAICSCQSYSSAYKIASALNAYFR